MVQKRTDVMHEEGIQLFGDLLLVGKIKGTIEWDPNAFQVHWTNFDDMSCFLTLQNAIASSTSHTSNIQ
jgi:hypothetical protein